MALPFPVRTVLIRIPLLEIFYLVVHTQTGNDGGGGGGPTFGVGKVGCRPLYSVVGLADQSIVDFY